MLQLHAAHRNFVLDNQTYYPNLTDDVILGRPAASSTARFSPCRPGPAWASTSTASGSRTGPRTTRARSQAGRRRSPTTPTTTAST